MKIAVFGLGYVGLANAVLLAPKFEVVAVDIDSSKVKLVNERKSPIVDSEIEQALGNDAINLTATTDAEVALAGAEFAIIATPTDYEVDSNYFNTRSVEGVLKQISESDSQPNVVIKSTIPIGFTKRIEPEYPDLNILFSPEFLREGRALYDNQHPARIIVSGDDKETANVFAEMMARCCLEAEVPKLVTGTTEAEAIKLFSNTYLAMRVAYFNELDTFARIQGLDTQQIINGVSLDPRIGAHYNNPSFGYGGYCLPKDTRQLLANFANVPQTLISAIVESNSFRKNFIARQVLDRQPTTVGVYRLTMKTGSDNFRSSAVQDVIGYLANSGVDIKIYEPTLEAETFDGYEIISDFGEFVDDSDVIIANRWSSELTPHESKVITSDLFRRD